MILYQHAQPPDDRRAEVERHQERRHHRSRRPERLVAEEVENGMVLRQWHEQMVEHSTEIMYKES
jgi:hypothetical protein